MALTKMMTSTRCQLSSAVILLFGVIVQFSTYTVAADLGTFGSTHNDLQNGVASYSLPADSRIPNDIFVLAFINYTYVNSEGKEVHFSEEKAKYGEGRVKNVIGKVVHITNYEDHSDHTACSDRIRGTNGRDLPPLGTPWIALVRRGNCPFDDKVKNVYAYRAAGVIVYNDRNETVLNKMKIIDQTRDIAAVLTVKYIGEDMAKIVDGGQELIASISEGRYARPLPNMNKTSVLFVSISFIVLMIISFVWLVFYYVQRFRYLQTKDRKSRQLCTVAKRVIAKIPTKSVKSEDTTNDIDNDCCAICIEPYKITDVIRVLPCRHEFHKSCIDPWLLEHRTCPMCKMDILKHYGFVVGAQNQIINFNNFVSTSTQTNTNRSPTTTSTNTNTTTTTTTPTTTSRPPASVSPPPPPPPPQSPPSSHQPIPSNSQLITTDSSSLSSSSVPALNTTTTTTTITTTTTTTASSSHNNNLNNLNNINIHNNIHSNISSSINIDHNNPNNNHNNHNNSYSNDNSISNNDNHSSNTSNSMCNKTSNSSSNLHSEPTSSNDSCSIEFNLCSR